MVAFLRRAAFRLPAGLRRSCRTQSNGHAGRKWRSNVRLVAVSVGMSAALGAQHAAPSEKARREDALYAASVERLFDLERAQATRAVLVKGFLSLEDMAELEAKLDELSRLPLGRFARDARGVPQLCDAPWETTYLHTDSHFARVCPGLRARLLALAERVDAVEGWGLLSGERQPHSAARLRTVELHCVRQGGALADRDHYDGGSLVTVDVMLSRPGADFTGGEFGTPEADGSTTVHAQFDRGDALVFVSHKRHFVAPVRSGLRRVLVAELWDGPERSCAHRCADPRGDCDFSRRTAWAERFMRAELPEM